MALIVASSMGFGQISSFPYLEEFEGGAIGWTANGDWELGTPTTTKMTLANSTCFGNSFTTVLNGNYNNNVEDDLVSPVFDFTGFATDPIVYFDMFRDLENCCDEVWLEMTTNGGVTWQKVMGPGTNWYNDLGNFWWDSTNDAWENTSAVLTGAAGNVVQLRFHFSSDGSAVREGVSIDNFYVGDGNFAELALVEILSPTSGIGLGANEPIIVVIQNNGNQTVNFTDYAICFQGDIPQACESTISSIAGNSLDTITLLSSADLSAAGDYSIDFYLSILGGIDQKSCNDSLSITLTNIPVITSFPYTEDFETGSAGWLADGASLWEQGIPTTFAMSQANDACINKVMATDLDANYSNLSSNVDYVTSIGFDFSSFTTDPVLQFDMFRALENCCDEVWLEMTLDGGASWQNVIGPGVNWYNDLGNLWWDNNTSGWINTAVSLTGAAGATQAQVRFAFSSDGSVNDEGVGFDNIYIGDGNFVELELVEVLSPLGGSICTTLPSSETITVVVRNNGSATANFSDYSLCMNGDVPQACESTTTNIIGGATDTLTLTTTADFTTAGTYNVTYYISSIGTPFKTCNDSLSVTYTILELPTSNLVDTASCDPISLNASADTILWSTGETTSTITPTVSGSYYLELTNAGCPTVYDTVVVTLNTATSGTDVVTECFSYTWIDGNTYTADNDSAMFTISGGAANGCDSIVTLDLTIFNVNSTTSTSDFTITSDVANAAYQWIDCGNNNAAIAGETGQSFTATANGNYAVVVTENGCSDTSSCVAITTIGLLENGSSAEFVLYPNPTQGNFVIEFSENQSVANATVYTLSGQVVSAKTAVNSAKLEMSIDAASGVYLVELQDQNNQRTIIKVTKW